MQPLGKGNYGDVMLAVHKGSGRSYAAKSIHKKEHWTLDDFRKRVAQEVATLQMVRHKNIIELVDHIPDGEQEDKHWVIMQLATGGELMQRIIDRFQNQKGYTEKEVAAIIADVLRACAHMHARHIVHCDLKPENLLYEHAGEDSALVIADFGFAQLCEDEHLTKFRGTLDYMAPELLHTDKKYNEKVDVWSVGCLMYVLLSGSLPFRRNWGSISQRAADNNVRELILSGKVDVVSGAWTKVEDSTKVLLQRMLAQNPADRPTAEQCLQDAWFKGGATDRHELAAIVSDLQRFNSSRGHYGYTSHSMAGIITQHSSISTLAALGSQETDLENRFKEGGIQSAVSLGWSENINERINSVSILANLAQQQEYQRKLIEEGGVRLVCNLVMRSGATELSASHKGELFFCASLMFNHIANNSSLRIALADEHVRHDVQRPAQVIPVLVKLAMEGPKRVTNNAVCALSRLAHETQLHQRLLDAGAIPLMVYVADPQQVGQDPFGKTAMSALECLLRAGVVVGLDELKRRVQAMCGPTRQGERLLKDVKMEEEAVDFYTTEVQSVTEKRRAFEEFWESRARQKSEPLSREQKEQVKIEYEQIIELQKQAQASWHSAETRLVIARACHRASTLAPSARRRPASDDMQSEQEECPLKRTLMAMEKRIAQYEPLRLAFQEASLPPITEYVWEQDQDDIECEPDGYDDMED